MSPSQRPLILRPMERAPRPAGALLLLLSLLPVAACDRPVVDDGRDRVPTYREAWLPADDPSLLDPTFTYALDELPAAGVAERTPWPGPYWPTYRDSINERWAGPEVPSPAEKYGLAFDVPGVEDAVSYAFGVDSLYGARCESDAECDPDAGSVCAKRRGEGEGRCSETWFGICHAWAPAAILEPEPARAVTHNGVEFRVNDLKALLSFTYTEGIEVRFLSLRCDEKGSERDLGDLPQCKDTNAGSFHVVVANLLGLRGESFVEDRTYDYEVWNQPVVSYEVTEQLEITGAEANTRLGLRGERVAGAAEQGAVDKGEWAAIDAVPVVPGQILHARMTGSGDADLYVQWDGAPTVNLFACRPYLVGSAETCELLVPEGVTTAHVAVLGYESATYELDVDLYGPAPAEYAFNPEAASLRRLRTELRWIGEAPSDRDGPLSADAEAFTFTDVYEYILELDEAGEIIGGEWLGGSRENHPDFLWVPVAKIPTVVAGVIGYDQVKMLLDQATAP